MAAKTSTNGKATNRLPKTESAVPLHALDIQTMKVPIAGISPLLLHKFSDKQKCAIENKQQKKAAKAKEARDPEQEFRDALYVLPGPEFGKKGCRLGLPAIAFKKAIVCAAERFCELKMTRIRGTVFVRDTAAGLVEIEYDEIVCREDTVRIGQGKMDIRYRPELRGWRAMLNVEFNAAAISPEQVVNIINAAGFGVGVGDYRVERNGECGQFRVVSK